MLLNKNNLKADFKIENKENNKSKPTVEEALEPIKEATKIKIMD